METLKVFKEVKKIMTGFKRPMSERVHHIPVTSTEQPAMIQVNELTALDALLNKAALILDTDIRFQGPYTLGKQQEDELVIAMVEESLQKKALQQESRGILVGSRG